MKYQGIDTLASSPKCKIFMGDVTNDSDFSLENNLTKNEISQYNQLNTILQQNQFKKIREIRTQTLGLKEINYTKYGAPYIDEKNTSISISHKNNYVVFGYSDLRIGIDLERISERIKKVKTKFLTELELTIFTNETDEIYTQLWTAKEAIYKIVSKPINFRNDILLSKDSNGLITGKIVNDENVISLNYLKINDYILCYVLQ